jgi:hypothetical protein
MQLPMFLAQIRLQKGRREVTISAQSFRPSLTARVADFFLPLEDLC